MACRALLVPKMWRIPERASLFGIFQGLQHSSYVDVQEMRL
jgi:hypothetical protein